MKYLIALIVGVFNVAFWPNLPQGLTALAVVGCLLLVLVIVSALASKPWLKIVCQLLLCLLIGSSYGVSVCRHMVDQQLPAELDGQDFTITGRVVGLPRNDDRSVSFYFRVEQALNIQGVAELFPEYLIPATLKLNWYYSEKARYTPIAEAVSAALPAQSVSAQTLEPQQRWRITVRLRKPRGSVNPSGFDYQRWLLRQGIAATGYVRDVTSNAYLSAPMEFAVDSLRYNIQQTIDKQPWSAQVKGLLNALTIGERAGISVDEWQKYSGLGLTHLLVISGLHVGLVALLAYGLIATIARSLGCFFAGVISHYWGAIAALIVAIAYGALAGWSIPTQRAVTMVAVGVVMVLLNLNKRRALGFFVAMLIVALGDPLAIWSPGFWLSFAAVAILLWLIPVYLPANKNTLFNKWLVVPIRVQLIMSIGLMPLLLLLGLPFSPLMPVINFLAIPWISFVIVPLCLLGAFCLPVAADSAVLVWGIAATQLHGFIQLTDYFNTLGSVINPGVWLAGFWPLLTFTAGIFLMLAPRGLGMCIPGLVLLLGAVLHQPAKPPLKLTVLDVGQGLAVVVQTPGYSLVYDTGPAYSDRFNAGTGIVLPYLRSQGISTLDTLMVSHDDNDHAGGALPLLESIEVATLYTDPMALHRYRQPVVLACELGLAWQRDSVFFAVLSPQQPYPRQDNNRSCVLQIRFGDTTILLPGDIERKTEQSLIKYRQPLGLASHITLLVAPHHGSNTSSSPSFIDYLQPEHVVFSAGFKHHFGHPHQRVVRRYQALNTEIWNTAIGGAITFTWDNQQLVTVEQERARARRFWY